MVEWYADVHTKLEGQAQFHTKRRWNDTITGNRCQGKLDLKQGNQGSY